MSSLRLQDRVSSSTFTLADGRRCRTPRSRVHPHFCFYRARKESQAQAKSQASALDLPQIATPPQPISAQRNPEPPPILPDGSPKAIRST